MAQQAGSNSGSIFQTCLVTVSDYHGAIASLTEMEQDCSWITLEAMYNNVQSNNLKDITLRCGDFARIANGVKLEECSLQWHQAAQNYFRLLIQRSGYLKLPRPTVNIPILSVSNSSVKDTKKINSKIIKNDNSHAVQNGSKNGSKKMDSHPMSMKKT